jgi:hypothetical protein
MVDGSPGHPADPSGEVSPGQPGNPPFLAGAAVVGPSIALPSAKETPKMKINCIACGHKIDLDDVYGDYEGQVKCFACKALLEIKTEEGNIKSIRLGKIAPRSADKELLDLSV